MTKKDKELLLKDLCARLPYGVIVKYKSQESEGQIKLGYGNIGYVAELGRGWWINCKPYLRPMSDMTIEERQIQDSYRRDIMTQGFDAVEIYMNRYTNWLDSRYFDWRMDGNNKTLIELGLALRATNKMYKIE